MTSFAIVLGGCTGGPINPSDGGVTPDKKVLTQTLSIKVPASLVFPQGANNKVWYFGGKDIDSREHIPDRPIPLGSSVKIKYGDSAYFVGFGYTLNGIRYVTKHFASSLSVEMGDKESYVFVVPDDSRMRFAPKEIHADKKFYKCSTLDYQRGLQSFSSPRSVSLALVKPDGYNEYATPFVYYSGDNSNDFSEAFYSKKTGELIGRYEIAFNSQASTRPPVPSLVGFYEPVDKDGFKGWRYVAFVSTKALYRENVGNYRIYIGYETLCADTDASDPDAVSAAFKAPRKVDMNHRIVQKLKPRFLAKGLDTVVLYVHGGGFKLE